MRFQVQILGEHDRSDLVHVLEARNEERAARLVVEAWADPKDEDPADVLVRVGPESGGSWLHFCVSGEPSSAHMDVSWTARKV